MKAYIYILNGKPVINPETMPEFLMNLPFPSDRDKKIIKKWESNLIEVENVLIDDSGDPWMIHPLENGIPVDFPTKITPGSQVEHDGPVITKIY